jgi:hypothetical protein
MAPLYFDGHEGAWCTWDDMDCFIKECAYFFHNSQSKGYFAFNFSSSVLVLLFSML